MSTDKEIDKDQKNLLHDLLSAEKEAEKGNLKPLKFLISRTKSGMSQEDVAYVKELIDEFYSEQ